MTKLPRQICSVDGCMRPHVARGLCTGHYQRWRKGHDLTPPMKPSMTRDDTCTIEGCGKPHAALGYCAMHYSRARRGQGLQEPSVYDLTAEERFWRSVNRRSADECWHWRSSCTSEGYGNFWTGERVDRAHRFSYELANGPIPEGFIVCHSCDEPSCVNPNHLWLGTDADNAADKMLKGRDNPPHGEANSHAKLTEREVLHIRQLYASGKHTQEALASQFGVTRVSISSLVRRLTWSHIG